MLLFRKGVICGCHRCAQRARVLKSEIEKLRQRLNKAQQLMLDGEMRMDEYRELKSVTEGEITRLEREYLQDRDTGIRLQAVSGFWAKYPKESDTLLQ